MPEESCRPGEETGSEQQPLSHPLGNPVLGHAFYSREQERVEPEAALRSPVTSMGVSHCSHLQMEKPKLEAEWKTPPKTKVLGTVELGPKNRTNWLGCRMLLTGSGHLLLIESEGTSFLLSSPPFFPKPTTSRLKQPLVSLG